MSEMKSVAADRLFGRPHAPATEVAPDEEDGPVWAPGDGDACLAAGPDGTVTLLWVGMETVLRALRLDAPAPRRILVDRAGATLRFADCGDRPVAVQGVLRLEDEVLHLAGVRVLRVWG
jgi:hypothetical protein